MINKKISEEQAQSIINAFFEINAPVKLYSQVVEMLGKLPVIETEKDEKGKESK